MVLADRVRASVRTYGLWPRGGRVLVALSGGPDSTALLHLLGELQRSGEVELAGTARVKHRLRSAAREDEASCGELAGDLQLPIVVQHANVGELAERWRT